MYGVLAEVAAPVVESMLKRLLFDDCAGACDWYAGGDSGPAG